MSDGVLIVDDHVVFRADARSLLESVGYKVVGEAEDAASAIAQTRRLQPAVVLLDVQLPDGSGFEVADEIGSEPGAPVVVLISSREAIDYGSRVEDSAATGFIHKPELSRARLEELIGPPG